VSRYLGAQPQQEHGQQLGARRDAGQHQRQRGQLARRRDVQAEVVAQHRRALYQQARDVLRGGESDR
jgi:hypothetical protein